MNRLIVVSWALVLTFGTAILTGCGGGGTSDAAKPGEDVLAKIKRTGVLKWGADESGGAPYVFGDPNDPKHIIGFEIDMMEKMAEHMGVKAERVQSSWPTLLENMNSKRTDLVMNGEEINEPHLKDANFSQPYFIYEQQLSVRAEDKDKYKSLDDLKDKTICILDGTEARNVLLKMGFNEKQIVTREDSLTPYTDLKNKRFDAVVAEWMIADYYAGKDKDIYNVPKTFAKGIYGVAVRKEKDSDSLLAEIDRVLKLMKENGELATIYKKWNIWNAQQKELGIVEK